MKIIYHLLAFILLVSCTNPPKGMTLQDLSKIDPDFEYSLDSLISRMDIIPLETTDSCLVGDISSIKEDNGYYFIISTKNETLYKFDKEGKFISKIGTQGEGPQEYVSLTHIDLDKEDKLIYVLDYFGQKLLSYNYDGEFINSYRLPSDHAFNEFKFFNNGIYYFSMSNSILPDVLYFDPKTKETTVISKREREMEAGEGYMGNNFVYRKNSDLHLYHYFNDTIYTIDNNKLLPSELFPLGKNRYTFDDLKDVLNTSKSHTSKIQLNGLVALPNYTFVFYVVTKFNGNGRKNFMAMYSEGDQTFFPHVNLISKKYLPLQDGEYFLSNDDSTIIRSIEATKLDKNICNEYKIDKEDNPVLCIYHFK